MDKNKKEKIPWLKSNKKTGGEKPLPKPIKALGSTSLHLASTASEGARRRHLWLCSVNNHANPPDRKWHSMRRKSIAKRQFYKGHRSLSIEKSVFSKRFTRKDKNFPVRPKHTRESRAGLSTPLLLCSFGSIDVEPTVEATAVFLFLEEFFLPCILQGNPRLVYRAAVTHSTIFPRDAYRHQ